MTKLTKEWLLKRISELEEAGDEIPFGLDEDANNTLEALKLALASLKAEPVGYADPQAFINFKSMGGKNAACTKEWMWRDHSKGLNPLYTAPLAPKDGRDQFEEWMINKWGRERQEYDFVKGKFLGGENYADSYTRHMWKAWTASRAAMLQTGNSPVIPEGYALVPIEPTPSMLNAAPQPTVKQHITGIGSAELYAGLAGLGAEKDVNDE